MAERQWKRDKSVTSLMAEAYNTALNQMVPRVAEYLRPVYGNSAVSKAEQRARFWQTAKGWTPEQEAALLAQGKSRQDIGLRKYPYREIDAKAGGRAEDERAQAEYVREMAALGPPEQNALESLAPPESDEQGAAPQEQPLLGLGAVAPAPVTAPVTAPTPAAPTMPPVAPTPMPMPMEGAV